MLNFRYTSPRGRTTVNPDADFLRHVIYKQPWLEWYHSANNEASLEVLVPTDDKDRYGMTYPPPMTGKYRISHEHPRLVIKQPESDEYFVMWCLKGDVFCPYNGEECEEFVTDHCGGMDYSIPEACLVSHDTAFEIIQEFVATCQKASCVEWVDYHSDTKFHKESDYQ